MSVSSSAALAALAIDGVTYSFPTEEQADRAALRWLDRSVVAGAAVYVYDCGDGSFTIGVVLVAGLVCVGRWTTAGYRSYRSQTVFVRVS